MIQPHILSIPPYVPGKPAAEVARELGIRDAVKMASNENALGPSPEALKAMADYASRMHVYPESSSPALRQAVAANTGVSPESVILGNGSDEILHQLAHVFVRTGDEAIIGSPTFSMYRICMEAFGGSVVPVGLRNHRFDLPAMAEAVTDRTRLVFLTVPNNPTGTIVSRSEFEAFLAALPNEGVVVVLDEAYREYVRDSDCPNGPDYIDADVPVLVLRTFSKIYGLAGLRIGYGIGPEWLIDLLNRVRMPFNVNAMAQEAALAAIGDSEHVGRSRELVSEGIDFIGRELRLLGLDVIESQANFVSFGVGFDAEPVYRGLLHKGVIVRHLASFGMPEFIRVTVDREENNRRFIRALTETLGEMRATA